MSWNYIIEAKCNTCGRFETFHRGAAVLKAAARSSARRHGWAYDAFTGKHTCPSCLARETKAKEAAA